MSAARQKIEFPVWCKARWVPVMGDDQEILLTKLGELIVKSPPELLSLAIEIRDRTRLVLRLPPRDHI